MRETITCTACGTVLGIPKAGIPKDGLSCNWCGYVNVKAPEPEAKPVAAGAAARETPRAAPKPKTPAHPLGDDEDDNGEAYELPPEEVKTRPCPSCGKKIDETVIVCIHCGYDTVRKERVERTFQPIDREWNSGWPFNVRLTLFLVMQALNVASLLFAFTVGGYVGVTVTGVVFYIGLQAFIFGSYDSVRIRRNRKGQTEVTITWRVCFIPMAPKKVNWREHEGVAVGAYGANSLMDWIILLILLPGFIIPAILFWYYVLRPDRFYAALCRDRGFPETYLYRGTDEKRAKEIAQVATDATGLPLTTPL
jgi:hypothetical protein